MGRMPFLTSNQQCQSTEGRSTEGRHQYSKWQWKINRKNNYTTKNITQAQSGELIPHCWYTQLSWAESLRAGSIRTGAGRTRTANITELLVHYAQQCDVHRLRGVQRQTLHTYTLTDGRLAWINGWSPTWRSALDHTHTNFTWSPDDGNFVTRNALIQGPTDRNDLDRWPWPSIHRWAMVMTYTALTASQVQRSVGSKDKSRIKRMGG